MVNPEPLLGSVVKVPNLHLTRRTSGIAAATAIVVGLGGGAFAEGGVPIVSSGGSDTSASTTSTTAGSPGASTDNVAAAVNTTDGRTVYAISLKIVQTNASTVDATNAAVADHDRPRADVHVVHHDHGSACEHHHHDHGRDNDDHHDAGAHHHDRTLVS